MLDSVHLSDSTIYGSSWASPELRPLFAEQNKIKGWLEVMTVLAEVQAEFGLIPEQAAAEIKTAYENLEIDEAFLKEVSEDFVKTNHSLMGLINAVKNRCGTTGGEWLCYGVTVQDITDTHTVRILLKVHEHFLEQLIEIECILVDLARLHRQTVMCGHTHGQSGLPITFGFKTATWLDELERHRQRLSELKTRLGVGQLGGGVGQSVFSGPRGSGLTKSRHATTGTECSCNFLDQYPRSLC